MLLIPAVGLSFFVTAILLPYLPSWFTNGIWPVSPTLYLLAGLVAAFGFMLGELPNSSIKRQCGIAHGAQPQRAVLRFVTMVFDRIDSLLGLLVMLSLVFPVPWQSGFYV